MLNCYETQRAEKTNKCHRVALKKSVSIVVLRFQLKHSFLYVGYFNLFPWAKSRVLVRETTLQHDMARTICFHLFLEKGWTFQNMFTFVHTGQ